MPAIPYFVDSTFAQRVGRREKTLFTVEAAVERTYTERLGTRCASEQNRKLKLKREWERTRDSAAFKRSEEFEMPNCEELSRVKAASRLGRR